MSTYESDQPAGDVHNPISAMRPGETTIFSIKRHPIGIIGYYASFVALLIIAAVVATMAPGILKDMYDEALVQKIAWVMVAIALTFSLIYAFIGQHIYNSNRWILTSDSLTQILQAGLFSTQVSQLGLENLEDVTVRQNGILAHMFNYGTLQAQTAGEHSKFIFIYCPRPNDYAQKILVTRENFEHAQNQPQQSQPQAAQPIQPQQ